MASYPVTIRTSNMMCACYYFEFFQKGFQVKYEQNTTTTRQFIPYTSLLTVRLEYDYNDRDSTLWLLLKQGIQYSYCFKNAGEADHVYEKLLEKL